MNAVRLTIIFLLAAFASSAGFSSTAALYLDAGIVEIKHNRADLNVEKLLIGASCFDERGSYVRDCVDFEIDGRRVNGPLELLAIEGDRIPVPRIGIRAQGARGNFFCVSMKVLFGGYTNQNDYVLYPDVRDRYSILSFCNVDELPDALASQPRFSHRRERTWESFASQFARPIRLNLSARSRQ